MVSRSLHGNSLDIQTSPEKIFGPIKIYLKPPETPSQEVLLMEEIRLTTWDG